MLLLQAPAPSTPLAMLSMPTVACLVLAFACRYANAIGFVKYR